MKNSFFSGAPRLVLSFRMAAVGLVEDNLAAEIFKNEGNP